MTHKQALHQLYDFYAAEHAAAKSAWDETRVGTPFYTAMQARVSTLFQLLSNIEDLLQSCDEYEQDRAEAERQAQDDAWRSFRAAGRPLFS